MSHIDGKHLVWFDRDSAQFTLGTAVLYWSNTVYNCSTSIIYYFSSTLLALCALTRTDSSDAKGVQCNDGI